MGKMIYSLVLMFAIQLALILFMQSEIPGSSLYTLLTNPTSWDSDSLLSQLITDGLLIVGAGVIAAGTLIYRNEFLIFAGLAAVFLSFGSSMYEFWQFIVAENVFGDASQIIGTMMFSALIIAFIITALDFSRGRD